MIRDDELKTWKVLKFKQVLSDNLYNFNELKTWKVLKFLLIFSTTTFIKWTKNLKSFEISPFYFSLHLFTILWTKNLKSFEIKI